MLIFVAARASQTKNGRNRINIFLSGNTFVFHNYPRGLSWLCRAVAGGRDRQIFRPAEL